MSLNQRIYDLVKVVIREDGEAYAPDETLRRREGACRDLAWLFVACCREAGLAARFVSGYQAGDPDTKDRYLHAWAEVYLPGGGWSGFDPTLGLAVADQHVVIAAAATPAGAAPVCGSFRGTGATAQMKTTISVEVGSD
jgi:transglutaminase-like putative cysteine protease